MLDMEYIRLRCVEEGDCWLWQGAMSAARPVVRVKETGQSTSIRRLIAMERGDKVKGKQVTCRCDESRCVNPDHVVVLNKSQMGKVVARRTGFQQLPSRNRKIAESRRKLFSNLTRDDVNAIRAAPTTNKEEADRHGISKYVVYSIRSGRSWRDYSNPFSQLIR